MGAWIETGTTDTSPQGNLLLPLWEHGLKLVHLRRRSTQAQVAPFMGAWIETANRSSSLYGKSVAPFMGAWIETPYFLQFEGNERPAVAPFMGAWIETQLPV